MISDEVMELFSSLESGIRERVDDAKDKICEHFNFTDESWLLEGMYDYYMQTKSQSALEIILSVKQPHDQHLFSRLEEDFLNSNHLQALELLTHLVNSPPLWLVNITQHNFLIELLNLLTNQNDLIILTSTLLVLHNLMTAIPVNIPPFLPKIFEGYCRLAAWITSRKNSIEAILLTHLETSLHTLFVQLYSIYPCSFVSYLQETYRGKDDIAYDITVKPMIESMRAHPMLLINNKDEEISAQRLRNMDRCDILIECSRYTIQKNMSTNYETLLKNYFQLNEDISSLNVSDKFWSPSREGFYSTVTPETCPIMCTVTNKDDGNNSEATNTEILLAKEDLITNERLQYKKIRRHSSLHSSRETMHVIERSTDEKKFSLSRVRRANSWPEIKLSNDKTFHKGTPALQGEKAKYNTTFIGQNYTTRIENIFSYDKIFEILLNINTDSGISNEQDMGNIHDVVGDDDDDDDVITSAIDLRYSHTLKPTDDAAIEQTLVGVTAASSNELANAVTTLRQSLSLCGFEEEFDKESSPLSRSL